MCVFGNSLLYLLLLVMCDQSFTFVNDDLMLELYSKYVSAVSKVNFTVSTRRLLKSNREYEIHVIKLKEVNGYKKHNLFVKESLRSGGRESYIYINNPVESKTPKAYLSLEEFKNLLTDRVMAQKEEFVLKRTKKDISHLYTNFLRQNTYKTKTQETGYIRNTEKIGNVPEKLNLQSFRSNTDAIKYNEIGEKNENNINNNKVINKDKTTTSAETVSATNINVHEKNVANSEKKSENNTTLHLVTNITEGYTNVETEISVNNQDINQDTTEPMTNNTTTLDTISDSQSINLEETELLTDTSTAFENILNLETNSEFVTNIESMANESFKIKEEPRTKNTTKSWSVSTEKRRSPLSRPLVFFGSR